MKGFMRVLFFIIFYVSAIFAYDTIEVLDSNITVSNEQYFISDKPLSTNEAYVKYISGNFAPLAKEAKSFGFSGNEYWYAFKVTFDKARQKEIFFEIRDIVAEKCDLYAFENGVLISQQSSGYLISPNERIVASDTIRFALNHADNSTIYLLKINSQYPHIAAFAIGDANVLNREYKVSEFIFIFAFGVFIALSIYNLFLFIITKDISYLYYILYLFGIFSIVSFYQGYTAIAFPWLVPISPLIVSASLQIQFIGLTLFTASFFRLKETDKNLQQKLYIALYANLLCALLVPIANGIQILSIISMLALFCIVIYIAIKYLLRGYVPAIFYLLASGVAIVAIIAFAMMIQGAFTYNFIGVHLMTFAIVWDMILLSFALAYRIKILTQANQALEKERISHARFTAIGETLAQVSHQWRAPLSRLGSIVANMEARVLYGNITKDGIVEFIDKLKNSQIHLTSIINMFQADSQSLCVERFLADSVILESIESIKDEIDKYGIDIRLKLNNNIYIMGDRHALFESLSAILNNAKDVLIQTGTNNSFINVTLRQQDSQIIITISDNGGGILIAPIESIFEPYISTKDCGTGIGLYMAKKIITERFNGTITVSNINGGASFEIALALR